MSEIKKVTPRNVAVFSAAQLTGEGEGELLVRDLVVLSGARVQGWTTTRRKGRYAEVFRILGKNRKTYDLAVGDWFVVLGTNGSVRACTSSQYKHDYRELDDD